MRLRMTLAAAAVAAAGTLVTGAPAAHACEGVPCDVACYVANTSVGRKLGLLCPA